MFAILHLCISCVGIVFPYGCSCVCVCVCIDFGRKRAHACARLKTNKQILGAPWLGSLCQNGTPNNRLLDPPVCMITFYNIQPKKRESQHPYTTLTPSHCAPTEPSRNIPTPSQNKQSWPVPEYGAFHYHPTLHFSPRLPSSGSAGSRRSRFIQQSAVRSGPAQHARPSHATGRLCADSPNN